MHSQRAILRLVDCIYGAVEDPALWHVFLEEFVRASRSEVATLYFQDLKNHAGTSEFVRGMDRRYNDSYRAYYAAKNIYLIRGRSLLQEGRATCSDELCPEREVLRSEFYNDWVRPQRLRSGLNGVFIRSHSLVGSLGAIRAEGSPAFGAEDKLLLAPLLPHLQRAFRLTRRVAELEILQRGNSDALDRWTAGVFLADAEGRVIASNRAAIELLNARDGLSIERGALEAANAAESRMLRRLIREAANHLNNGQSNGAMLVERPSGKRPLQIFVAPSVNEQSFFGSGGRALVFATDPEAATTQAGVLQKLYSLTPAEANVAELLTSGKSVKEIADTASVRENTVRIHLKRVFDKTCTKRQAELVKLLLSVCSNRS